MFPPKRKRFRELDGLGYRMPLVFGAFFLGALSIIGVPPMGGSWSKFLLMSGGAERGMMLVLVVLGVSSLLNVWYLLEPVWRGFFFAPKNDKKITQYPLVVAPLVVTALLSLGLFFTPWIFADLVELVVMR